MDFFSGFQNFVLHRPKALRDLKPIQSGRDLHGTKQSVCRRFRQPRSKSMDSREALIALNVIEGVGRARVRSLQEHFGDAPEVFKWRQAIAEQEAGLEAERQPIGRPVAGKL